MISLCFWYSVHYMSKRLAGTTCFMFSVVELILRKLYLNTNVFDLVFYHYQMN